MLWGIKQEFLATTHIFRNSQPPPIVRPHELVKSMEKYFAHKLLEDDKSLVIRYMKRDLFRKAQFKNK